MSMFPWELEQSLKTTAPSGMDAALHDMETIIACMRMDMTVLLVYTITHVTELITLIYVRYLVGVEIKRQ